MIDLNKTLSLELSNMGLFETTADWSHPIVQVETHELIYCIDGDLNIFEGAEKYVVHPGEMLLLEPNVLHGGYDVTHGHTSFYWLHFRCPNICALNLPRITRLNFEGKHFFREIMHYHQIDMTLAELTLVKGLLELKLQHTANNKTVYEIDEYIRIHSHRSIPVSEIAQKFNYSPDYISKILKLELGETLKERMIRHRLSLIDALLTNTNDTIKQIAFKTGFSSENHLVKFYKYNKGVTPTKFRLRFYKIHMNNH